MRALGLFLRGGSFKMQLVRGALGVGGLNLLSLPLTMATSILLARGLGPYNFGQYVFALSVISILALPLGPGLAQFLTREVAKYHQLQDWALLKGLLRSAHLWLALGSTLILLVIGLFAATNTSWAEDGRWTVIFLATVLLPLIGLNALRSATLRGLGHVIKADLPELLVRPGLHFLIVGTMVLLGVVTSATAIFSQILATAIAFLLGAWFLRKLRPFELGHASSDYRFANWSRALIPFTLLASVGTLNNEIGILILGWLSNSENVAAFRVAMSGALVVALPLTIVIKVTGPHITRYHQDGNTIGLQRLFTQSARSSFLVSLPVALLLLIFGEPLVSQVFGEEYRKSATLPLKILVFGQLMNVLFGSTGTFLTMCGFERSTVIGQFVALLVNTLAAIVLIPHYGAVGAALATTLGIITWNCVLSAFLLQKIRIRPLVF